MKPGKDRQFTEVGNGIIDIKSIIIKGLEAGADFFIVEQDICDKQCLEAVNISLNNLQAMSREMSI